MRVAAGAGVAVRRRADSLQLAVLALLSDGPLHGYEVRRRLDVRLGAFRALSYGTLYPCLRKLQAAGEVAEAGPEPAAGVGRRGRVVYEITPAGRDHLAELLAEAGPDSWEDDAFGVRFALFTRMSPLNRIRVLEGRRARLLERVEVLSRSIERAQAQLDAYVLEAQRHGLDTARREVDWIDRLIRDESSNIHPAGNPPAGAPEPEEIH